MLVVEHAFKKLFESLYSFAYHFGKGGKYPMVFF